MAKRAWLAALLVVSVSLAAALHDNASAQLPEGRTHFRGLVVEGEGPWNAYCGQYGIKVRVDDILNDRLGDLTLGQEVDVVYWNSYGFMADYDHVEVYGDSQLSVGYARCLGLVTPGDLDGRGYVTIREARFRGPVLSVDELPSGERRWRVQVEMGEPGSPALPAEVTVVGGVDPFGAGGACRWQSTDVALGDWVSVAGALEGDEVRLCGSRSANYYIRSTRVATPPSIAGVRLSAGAVSAAGCPEPTALSARADVLGYAGVAGPSLHYREAGGEWTTVAMRRFAGATFAATASGLAQAGLVDYYIEAGDESSGYARSPVGQVTVSGCGIAPPPEATAPPPDEPTATPPSPEATPAPDDQPTPAAPQPAGDVHQGAASAVFLPLLRQ